MGYGLLESYGLFLRDEHGSIGFLWASSGDPNLALNIEIGGYPDTECGRSCPEPEDIASPGSKPARPSWLEERAEWKGLGAGGAVYRPVGGTAVARVREVKALTPSAEGGSMIRFLRHFARLALAAAGAGADADKVAHGGLGRGGEVAGAGLVVRLKKTDKPMATTYTGKTPPRSTTGESTNTINTAIPSAHAYLALLPLPESCLQSAEVTLPLCTEGLN
ncbi:hypothetical protein B0H13DRAFT_2653394 [Mycena leptocephala]|nr:hypothetical protein B0H13DRAFT_2653394 [Mycena leptocephala]